MPKGSFWTQPAGEVHITAAQGDQSLAYIEVEDDFKVLPAKGKFDNGERPINVHQKDIIWLTWPNFSHQKSEVQVAFLWGNPIDRKPSGTLIKLGPQYQGTLLQKMLTPES
jgi:hypothetical protein